MTYYWFFTPFLGIDYKNIINLFIVFVSQNAEYFLISFF
jgi:hypothetical protein